MFDAKDIEILLTIQENPLATLSQIADQISTSISNTSSRLNKLENEYKIFQGVHVDLNLPALEMEILDVFFEVSNKSNLQLLESKFCHHHPYVQFRDRCYGAMNGLFMQFRIPKGGFDNIQEIAEILQTKHVITSYEFIRRNPNEIPIQRKSSLSCWNASQKRWVFDWKTWKKGFLDNSHNKHTSIIQTQSILDQMTELDIKLLAQLTIDARRKNVVMLKNIGLTSNPGVTQKVSRRVRFLKESAIAGYRVFLQGSTFDLYQSIIIRGRCNSNIATQLGNYLRDGHPEPFPFQSLYFIAEDGFFWYVRAPPSHLSEFTDFIWEICSDYELYILDYQFSQIYSLWDQTFDSEHKTWKMNKEFMVDNIIDKMFQKPK